MSAGKCDRLACSSQRIGLEQSITATVIVVESGEGRVSGDPTDGVSIATLVDHAWTRKTSAPARPLSAWLGQFVAQRGPVAFPRGADR